MLPEDWGISQDAINHFGIIPAQDGFAEGYHEFEWGQGVCYPCLTPAGGIIHRVRQIGRDPKYLSASGSAGALSLYAPGRGILQNVINQAEGTLFIVEGEKDAWVLASGLIYNVTSIFGGKNIRSAHFENLADLLEKLGVVRVVFIPDLDDEGFSAAYDIRELLKDSPIVLRIVQLPGEFGTGYDNANYWKDIGFDADALWQGLTVTLPDVDPVELDKYAPPPEIQQQELGGTFRGDSDTGNDNWFAEYNRLILDALRGHGFGTSSKTHSPCIFPENHKHGDDPARGGSPSARVSFDKSPHGVYVCHCQPKQGISLGTAQSASIVGERVGVGTWEMFKVAKHQEKTLKRQTGIKEKKIDLATIPEDAPPPAQSKTKQGYVPAEPPETPEDSPLWDVHAERNVLGAIFSDPHIFRQVWAKIQPDDFKVMGHVWIFTAMGRVHAQGNTINITSTAAELKHMGQLDESGGVDYLRRIVIEAEREQDWSTYVDVVASFAIQRAMLVASADLVIIANDTSKTIGQRQGRWAARAREVSQRNMRDSRTDWNDLLDGYMDKLDALAADPNALFGLRTGFPRFDSLTRGLKRTESALFAGPTSIGKTSFLLSVALNVLLDGGRVGFFTMEMSPEILTERLMQMLTNLSLPFLADKLAKLTPEEAKQYMGRVYKNIFNAVTDMSQRRMFIESASTFRPTDLEAATDRLMNEGMLDIVLVDYIQKITPNKSSTEGEAAASEASGAIKSLAMDFKIPVLAAASMNRATGARPQLNNVKGSGDFEYDADIIIFPWNPRIYKGERQIPGNWEVDVIVDKNRNGGTGTVPFTFERSFTRYVEADRDLLNEL